jgi:SAM-dependent methyltransferase
MYRQIRAALGQPMRGRILGVSGIENFRTMIAPEADVVDLHYPDVDIHKLAFPDGQFDFMITDQVLEHVPDPQLAMRESFRVLKQGGIAVHTTCFLNPIHKYPDDYWRFSRAALIALCSPYAEIVHCASWGSRYAAALIILADRMRGMEIPEGRGLRRWLATHNEENYPIHVWIVARRVR